MEIPKMMAMGEMLAVEVEAEHHPWVAVVPLEEDTWADFLHIICAAKEGTTGQEVANQG
jgi:hypothetical protein